MHIRQSFGPMPTLLALGGLAAVFLSGPPARAATVTTHNTGEGLSAGATDPNYSYQAVGGPSGQAVVLSQSNYLNAGNSAGSYPVWDVTDLNTYQWISTADSISPNPGGAAPLEVDYTTTFDLTGLNPASASLTGDWEVDDQGYGVLLNGTPISGDTGLGENNNGAPWSIPQTFAATSGFVSGVNTLEFRVNQYDNGADGFRARYAVTDHVPLVGAAVPEPSPIALLALGLLPVGLLARRRRA